MRTIAIDCGASFIKGALICEGEIIKRICRHSPMVCRMENIMSPNQIQALLPMIKQIIVELIDGQTEIKLCISNEMHGFILAKEDGTPYTDYISWQKEYGKVLEGGESSLDILGRNEFIEDIKYTGMPLRAGLPSSNMLYLKKSGHLSGKDKKLYFYTLGDYILRILSGKQPMCHLTNAAATGLFDLQKNDWNHKLIDVVCNKNIVFPDVGTENMIFEMENVKIYSLPAIGDQQAALLGAGLINDKTLSFNLGTGAQVSKLVSVPLYEKQYQIRPYFYGMYLKTIPHLPSGRALNVYIRFLQDILSKFALNIDEEDIWKIILNEEMQSDDCKIICDLSFFENPISNHMAGSIENIGEYSLTIGNLFNAIFRQMGENFIWAASIIEPDADRIENIVFSGGVAKKIERVRKHIISHYSHKVDVSIASDETLLGLYCYGQNLKN